MENLQMRSVCVMPLRCHVPIVADCGQHAICRHLRLIGYSILILGAGSRFVTTTVHGNRPTCYDIVYREMIGVPGGPEQCGALTPPAWATYRHTSLRTNTRCCLSDRATALPDNRGIWTNDNNRVVGGGAWGGQDELAPT